MHAIGDRLRERRLVRRSGQDDAHAELVGKPIGHPGEAFRRPAGVALARSRVHADIAARLEPCRQAAGGELVLVFAQDRELEVRAGLRRPKLADQVQQAFRFGAGLGIGDEEGLFGAQWLAAAVARHRGRPEAGNDVVRDVAAAVQLHGQAEFARAHGRIERGQVVMVHGLLG